MSPKGDNARCVSPHAEDLADGRTVAPGEFVRVSASDVKHPHNKRLIDEGLLLVFEEPEEDLLAGKELDKRAQELNIEGRSDMSADELRAAVAAAEENESKGDGS